MKIKSSCISLAIFYFSLVASIVLMLLTDYVGLNFYYCLIPMAYCTLYVLILIYIDIYKLTAGDRRTKTLATVIFIILNLPLCVSIVYLIPNIVDDYIGFKLFEKLRAIGIWYALAYGTSIIVIAVILFRIIFMPLLTSISNIVCDLFLNAEKEIRKRLIGFLMVLCFIIIISSIAFYFVYKLDPDAYYNKNCIDLKFHDFIYLSIITITTLGYGDIYPNSLPARTIASIELILGIILIAGYLSYIVSKLGSTKK